MVLQVERLEAGVEAEFERVEEADENFGLLASWA
jgi:hypothetical protein